MQDTCACGSTAIHCYNWDEPKEAYCFECANKFWYSANTVAQALAEVEAAQRLMTNQVCVTVPTGEAVSVSSETKAKCRDFRKSGKGRPALALPCLNCKVPYSLHD